VYNYKYTLCLRKKRGVEMVRNRISIW